MASSRPFVILNAAASVDGKIATRRGDSSLSSAADLRRVHRLRSRVDAIIIGKNTALRDDPMLTVRHVRGRNPVRIILDSNGELPENSNILQTSNKVSTMIAVSKHIKRSNLEKLKKFPVQIITLPGRDKTRSLLRVLHQKEIRTVLVEGGGQVNWEFIKSGLFDELFLAVSPCIIGGPESVSLVGGAGFARTSDSPKLSLKSARRLGDHLILHYLKL